MTLWLRVRRAWVLVGALCVLAAALVAAGNNQVVVPTVIGGGASAMAWSALLPLAWAAAACRVFESMGAPVEARPDRRLPRLDSLLFVASTVAVAGTFLLLAPATATVGKVLIVAHLMVLAGLGVAGSALFGAGVGVLLATTLLLATCSYSPRLRGARFVRVLQPDVHPWWSLTLGVALCLGAIVLLITARQGAGAHRL